MMNAMVRNRMRQQTFAEGSFERFCKPTRREIFLVEMDRFLPWARLSALADAAYPEPGNS